MTVSCYAGKQIVVVGAGKSGIALCRFLASRAGRLVLSDRRPATEIPGLDVLDGLPIHYDFGGHTCELFTSADLVVLSPGVPETIDPVQAARAVGVAVIGEIELAARELTAPVIGITGTNGKSTTTEVLGAILQAWGKKTFVGGNLGQPLTEAAQRSDWDWIVVELSSFQLETIDTLHPRYGLLLNISADHLDRYPDMASYAAAKRRLFENMIDTDIAILNADDNDVLLAADGIAPEVVLFSCRAPVAEGIGFDGIDIVWERRGVLVRFPVAELKIKGLHNIANVMAALVAPLIEGCPPQIAWRAACDFTGLPHRMALVRELDGVCWYDDSKGTNIGSVVMSLAGLNAPVTLIAGGKDKGGDFGILAETVRSKVAQLILIGEATERMARELDGCTTIHRADSLESAVILAQQLTPAGGAVLLSPGCSSFDMFKSYIERGERFSQLVRQLRGNGEVTA